MRNLLEGARFYILGRFGTITTENADESRDLHDILLNQGISCSLDPSISKEQGVNFAPRKFILGSNTDIALVRKELKAMGHQEREQAKVLA